MNPTETYLYLERLGEHRMRLTLEGMERALALLEHPDHHLTSVIVGGTNGKGSVSAFLTSIALAAKYKVGTFTSPHLESVLERIAIHGKPIDELLFCEIASTLRHKLERARLAVSYFEFLNLLAIEAFRHAQVDLAIFEVGLGGRLDSTNALKRVGVALTPIDLDHQQYLGSTRAEIAKEKADLLRRDAFFVCAPQTQEAFEMIQTIAQEKGVRGDFVTPAEVKELRFTLGIPGEHQKENAEVARRVVLRLNQYGFEMNESQIKKGLHDAFHPGRLECWKRGDGVKVWLDVAHNPHAMKSATQFFQSQNELPLSVVFGALQDKDWMEMLSLLKRVTHRLFLCEPRSPRAWNLETVVSKLRKEPILFEAWPEPLDAFKAAESSGRPILVTGSFYVTGLLRAKLPELGFTHSG